LNCIAERVFYWKVLHRSIFTETRLLRMRKSDGICKLCNLDPETIIHLLYSCTKIHRTWYYIEQEISKITNTNVLLNERDIIFGLDKNENPKHVYCIGNFIILQCKWIIWKHRNEVKYSKLVVRDCVSLFKQTMLACKLNTTLLLLSQKSTKLDIKCRGILEKNCRS
jgi:hypothetical protein